MLRFLAVLGLMALFALPAASPAFGDDDGGPVPTQPALSKVLDSEIFTTAAVVLNFGLGLDQRAASIVDSGTCAELLSFRHKLETFDIKAQRLITELTRRIAANPALARKGKAFVSRLLGVPSDRLIWDKLESAIAQRCGPADFISENPLILILEQERRDARADERQSEGALAELTAALAVTNTCPELRLLLAQARTYRTLIAHDEQNLVLVVGGPEFREQLQRLRSLGKQLEGLIAQINAKIQAVCGDAAAAPAPPPAVTPPVSNCPDYSQATRIQFLSPPALEIMKLVRERDGLENRARLCGGDPKCHAALAPRWARYFVKVIPRWKAFLDTYRAICAKEDDLLVFPRQVQGLIVFPVSTTLPR